MKRNKLIEKRINLDGDIYRLYEDGQGYRSVQNSLCGIDKEVSHISIQAALNSRQRKLFSHEHCVEIV